MRCGYRGSPVLWASAETHLNMLSYRIGSNRDFKVRYFDGKASFSALFTSKKVLL